jgi:cell division protein FtsI (penicillin-binding protein 3)
MQYVAQVALRAGVEAKHARSGTAIVMNPYTGAILALANYPDYNPNVPPTAKEDPMARLDLGASVPFEPGSMFKVITLTAALETTSLRPDSLIPTGNGVLHLPGRTIHESHHGLGTITMEQVLEKSSNIGAILIGMRVGPQNMYDYARRFGFGQRSGLPLPAESPGLLRPLKRWGTTSLASISMGQEVSVTSVQLARACSVIANGGLLVKPRLILKRGGKPEPLPEPVRIIRPETAITMRQMMEGVVLRGTGRLHARLQGYTSAGKTGTAQIYDSASHHYSHFYNASFMGFAPVTNPALVVVVTVHHTSGEQGQGADAAAPVFKIIMSEGLRMLDVPRDIPEELEAKKKKTPEPKVEEDDVSIADLGEPSIMEEEPTARQLLAEQMPRRTADEDEIPPAKPEAAQAVAPGFSGGTPPVVAVAAPAPAPPTPPKPKGPVIPDFRGLAMQAVAERAAAQGIQVMLEGSGIARAQMPLPGTPMRQGARVRIVFAR